MSTHDSEPHERQAGTQGGGTDVSSRAKRTASKVTEIDENGRLTALLGGAILVGGLRSRSRNRWRATIGMLAGTVLVALGLRRWRRAGSADEAVSDEAHAATVQGGSEDTDRNPRDVTEGPDVETETDPDEGDVQFTTEQALEPGDRPELDEEAGVEDPRRSDDDGTEIDLSEAAVADEPSEAAGPSPQQAQPTSTEETEPERTPDEDASHVEHDAAPDTTDGGDDAGGSDGPDDREAVETGGGATVHTDTMEAGTTDVDEDDVTEPDDDLNEEPPGSERQTSSRLADDESEDDRNDGNDEE